MEEGEEADAAPAAAMPAEAIAAVAKGVASAAYVVADVERIEAQVTEALQAGGKEITVGNLLLELPTVLLDVPLIEDFRVKLDCPFMIPSDFLVYAGRERRELADGADWSGDTDALLAHLSRTMRRWPVAVRAGARSRRRRQPVSRETVSVISVMCVLTAAAHAVAARNLGPVLLYTLTTRDDEHSTEGHATRVSRSSHWLK